MLRIFILKQSLDFAMALLFFHLGFLLTTTAILRPSSHGWPIFPHIHQLLLLDLIFSSVSFSKFPEFSFKKFKLWAQVF